MKNKGGRPTVLTEDTVQKLEKSLQEGFSITKACKLSGISVSSYYDHLEKSPQFSEKMNLAQEWAKEKAAYNVVEAIRDGDVQTSRWFLDREERKEERRKNPGQTSNVLIQILNEIKDEDKS